LAIWGNEIRWNETKHVELEQFWHAFTSRGFDSVSWAFLLCLKRYFFNASAMILLEMTIVWVVSVVLTSMDSQLKFSPQPLQDTDSIRLPSQQKITVVALLLQCYVRLSVAVCLSSSVTLCIVAKLCVLEQKLLLRAYRKLYYGESTGIKMNDVGLCLGPSGRIKIMSAIASHSPLNISETVTE